MFSGGVRILLKLDSIALQEKGNSMRAKKSSASRADEFQSAFLRLVKVRWRGSGKLIWKEFPSWTTIGRCSELRVVRVPYSKSLVM